MPRNAPRKTDTGIPSTAPGQPYGVAGEQQAAMKAVPLPDSAPAAAAGPPPMPGGQAPPTSAEPGGGAPPMPTGGPPQGIASALQAAMAMAPPPGGGIDRPTEMPNQPLTTAPPARPGRVTPTARVLAMLAENNNNDPALQQAASAAARAGY